MRIDVAQSIFNMFKIPKVFWKAIFMPCNVILLSFTSRIFFEFENGSQWVKYCKIKLNTSQPIETLIFNGFLFRFHHFIALGFFLKVLQIDQNYSNNFSSYGYVCMRRFKKKHPVYKKRFWFFRDKHVHYVFRFDFRVGNKHIYATGLWKSLGPAVFSPRRALNKGFKSSYSCLWTI